MAWTREQIAQRAIKEIQPGQIINLGVGIPTLCANYPSPEGVKFHNENGHVGQGGWPFEGEEDADLISASKQTVTEVPGSSFFDAATSFGMIRGGHLDATFIGGMQVSQTGDLANWAVPGQLVKGMGGAMDLVANTKRVIILMSHCTKDGKSKMVQKCDLPLTGVECVDVVITDLGVFEPKGNGFFVRELAPGVSHATAQSQTNGDLL